VLVLSIHDETLYAERVLRAGASGFIMKDEAAQEVAEAIRRVAAGEIYLSKRMVNRALLTALRGETSAPGTPLERLSDRELEVFELMGTGMSTRQVAERLHLSVKTVETHRSRIKRKLGLNSATDLLRHAVLWAQGVRARGDGPFGGQ